MSEYPYDPHTYLKFGDEDLSESRQIAIRNDIETMERGFSRLEYSFHMMRDDHKKAQDTIRGANKRMKFVKEESSRIFEETSKMREELAEVRNELNEVKEALNKLSEFIEWLPGGYRCQEAKAHFDGLNQS